MPSGRFKPFIKCKYLSFIARKETPQVQGFSLLKSHKQGKASPAYQLAFPGMIEAGTIYCIVLSRTPAVIEILEYALNGVLTRCMSIPSCKKGEARLINVFKSLALSEYCSSVGKHDDFSITLRIFFLNLQAVENIKISTKPGPYDNEVLLSDISRFSFYQEQRERLHLVTLKSLSAVWV